MVALGYFTTRFLDVVFTKRNIQIHHSDAARLLAAWAARR
jgi:hypothetical protein